MNAGAPASPAAVELFLQTDTLTKSQFTALSLCYFRTSGGLRLDWQGHNPDRHARASTMRRVGVTGFDRQFLQMLQFTQQSEITRVVDHGLVRNARPHLR
ncbi:MAG: hypothetical protein LC808_35755 [Actinobacteria bacterium]|nr:hypothetical protein [Actinomycetota bacterium]